MYKKHISLALVAIFSLFMVGELDAQRTSRKRSSDRTERSRRSTDDTERISLKDKLAYDIYLGNIGLGRGFSITAKGGVGYKPIDRITTGLGTKIYYLYENLDGPNNFTQFSYGFYPYARVALSDQIYLKGEYVWLNIDGGFGDNVQDWIPMVGAGYASGFGPWKFGIELLLIASDSDRDRYYGGDLFEYMFSALYNF